MSGLLPPLALFIHHKPNILLNVQKHKEKPFLSIQGHFKNPLGGLAQGIPDKSQLEATPIQHIPQI
jgi:hypothetical protein